jgi:hypothetical protein
MASDQIFDINSLDSYEFELLVIRLLKEMGLQVEETKKTGDGGIDAIARSEEPITGGLFVIQCKKYLSNVGEPQVRDLYGVVNHTNASRGILITSSDFTEQAKRFAKGKPIELINGEVLKSLLIKYEIGVPEDKNVARLPKPYKRLYKGLLDIADKIKSRLEIDSILINPGKKECDLGEFLQIGSQIVSDNMPLALENLNRVLMDINSKSADALSESYIDSRVKIIKDIIEDMLGYRETLVNIKLESEYTACKQSLIEVLNAYLVQFADFVESWSPIIELDGKLVDKDIPLEFEVVFRPDVNEQIEKSTRELKLASQNFSLMCKIR